MTMKRQVFYKPEDISEEVKKKVNGAFLRNETIDYLTFVPDGEPTLDLDLGKTIALLKETKIPIAVLTNASLIWQNDVREDLLEANMVSLKVDAISEDLWKKVNRPTRSLKLDKVLEGITEFTEEFKGKVISETMLLDGVDYETESEKIATFLKNLKSLSKAYISVPTRPPTERWVKPAKEETLNAAFQVFSEKLNADRAEYLIGYEGNAFAFTGKMEEDLLSITAVHPMRKEAVEKFLKKANADWQIIHKLLQEGKLREVEYEGNTYYMRKLLSRGRQ